MSSEKFPTGRHITAARGLLKISQEDLARYSGVSVPTILSWETEQRVPRRESVMRIRGALERLGIEFLNSDRPGVRLHPDKAVILV